MFANKKICFFTAFFVLLGVLSSSVAAEESRNLLSEDSSTILLEDGGVTVTQGDVNMMLEDMTLAQRKKLAADEDSLKKLLYNDLTLKKRAQEAIKKGLQNNPLVQWKLENAKRNVLSEALGRGWREDLQLSQDFDVLAREYYDAHPEEFRVAEKIKAAHILFSVDVENELQVSDQRKRAEQVLEQIRKEGLDFAEAAKQYSADKSNASSGGELNYFARGRMVKPFEEAVFSLEVGELGQVVQTQFGFHLIKLLDRQPESTLPYDKVKQRLVTMQKEKFIAAEQAKYLEAFDVNQNTTAYVRALEAAYKTLRESVSDR